jgi:twitching motility two-component system response regulator PilH
MAKKVLIVDDSPTDATNMKTILGDAGCLVVVAVNGADAVAKARLERPSVIFLDIVMPEMDGYETCRQLAADPATRDIPVVFVSSKAQKADQVWAQMQGGRGYVIKPYKPDQLIDQLKVVG